MRAAGDIYVEWVEHEAVALDKSSGRIHYLNPQAALIYALILEHGYEAALRELDARFATEPEREEQVAGVVEQMVEAGLLIDD